MSKRIRREITDPGLNLVLDRLNGPANVATLLSITGSAVSQWTRVPEAHVLRLAELAGAHPSELRPDRHLPPDR